MEYFQSVVDFVDRNLIWVAVLFLAATLIEAIVFFVKSKREYESFDTENFYVAVFTNVLGLLALYVVSCLCVGFVNCVKAQDWHFWTNYTEFMSSSAGVTILSIVGGIALVALVIALIGGGIFGILGAILGAGVVVGVAYLVGFVLYVVVALLWIVIKLIWFVFSGFFESIYEFIVKYWMWMLIVFLTPGVLYGAIKSLLNYIRSLRDQVFSK